MVFTVKALHFEQYANKARDEDSRRRFAEAAHFYRQLAAIAPDFPPKFRGGTIWRGTLYEKRAEECRTMSDYFTDPNTKAMLSRLADTYESMARQQVKSAAE